MIKREHIDRAELMQLGKMLLLLTEGQQITMEISSMTKLNKQVSLMRDLPKAS
jgi:hypothetical protein